MDENEIERVDNEREEHAMACAIRGDALSYAMGTAHQGEPLRAILSRAVIYHSYITTGAVLPEMYVQSAPPSQVN